MEALSRKASEQLQDLISDIWYMEFDESELVERTDLIMPTGCLNVVFNYADDQFLINEKGESERLPDVLITGQLDRVWKIRYGDRLKQVGIILKPVGFFRLFKAPGALFAGTFIDAEPAPWSLAGLYEDIRRADDFDQSFHLIEDYLRSNAKGHDHTGLVNEIISDIESTDGNISMEELAASYKKSISSIERYFKKMIGMTPKAYSNIVKFRKAMKVMDGCDSILDYYYDQSHFIKSCKKYTGKTPTQLMKTNDEISLNHMLTKR